MPSQCYDRLPDTRFRREIHVRSIPWIKGLFSDTALYLSAIRSGLLQGRIGRASTRLRCTGGVIRGRDADQLARWLKSTE